MAEATGYPDHFGKCAENFTGNPPRREFFKVRAPKKPADDSRSPQLGTESGPVLQGHAREGADACPREKEEADGDGAASSATSAAAL
eukprot:g7334.t1